MSNIDFSTMKQTELYAYVLAHREDREAFYAYVDRLHAEATWIEMPPSQSVDDLGNHPKFVERVRRNVGNA
ncbi:MAG: hypothetical protein WCP16_03805 [Pseudanabaena sp. ELA645]|jgi:hypothetical protein